MEEYIELNHMSPINEDHSNLDLSSEFFLPHQPVFKETSTPTNSRVVFNASAPSSSNLSLNDVLLTGPTIQLDLMTQPLKFRNNPIALTADIAKMYRR